MSKVVSKVMSKRSGISSLHRRTIRMLTETNQMIGYRTLAVWPLGRPTVSVPMLFYWVREATLVDLLTRRAVLVPT